MAPKKFVNERNEAAKDKKESKKKEDGEKASKAADDSYWEAQGDGQKSKAGKKKGDLDEQRMEAQKKKEETKKLAEEEEASLGKTKEKIPKAAIAKITKHQMDQQKEFDAKVRMESQMERDLVTNRMVTEDKHSKLLMQENKNRQETLADARSVGDALSALNVEDAGPSEKHPEKRMKAAFAAYEERELPILKQDKPNMKQSQYKELLWKQWQKSPENPIYAATRQ